MLHISIKGLWLCTTCGGIYVVIKNLHNNKGFYYWKIQVWRIVLHAYDLLNIWYVFQLLVYIGDHMSEYTVVVFLEPSNQSDSQSKCSLHLHIITFTSTYKWVLRYLTKQTFKFRIHLPFFKQLQTVVFKTFI